MALFKEKKRLEDEVAVLPRQTNPGLPQGRVVAPPIMGQPTAMNQAPVVIPPQSGVTPPPVQGYGIEQLTRLMRELPGGNVELVVRVLKKTLESVRISVPGLIQDAARRETELEEKMAGHRRAIAALEEEISNKKRAIEELEATYREVMMVKERLNLALSLEQQEVSVRPVSPELPQREEVIITTLTHARGPNRG